NSAGGVPGRIGVTTDQRLRAVFWENRRSDPPARRPESSCTIIHLAMSVALELMPPAGFVLSLVNGAIGRTLPSMGACGVATLPPPPPPPAPPAAADEWRTVLPVIPTRARILDCTKSSHDCPETVSITWPATR